MIRKIRKMQFLCGLMLILQLACFKWIVPFHLIAVILSLIVILNQRKFKVIQLQYHYYLIFLYIFRLWIFSFAFTYALSLVYIVLCLYVGLILILFSLHCLF